MLWGMENGAEGRNGGTAEEAEGRKGRRAEGQKGRRAERQNGGTQLTFTPKSP
jgi:hypothetical protein